MSHPSGMPVVRRARLVRLGESEEYGPAQLALSAVVVLGPAAFVACAILAGAPVSWWWLILTPFLVVVARFPESAAQLVLWFGLLVVWTQAVPGPFTWWSVPAALVVLATHTALVMLAGRPTVGDLAAGTVRRIGLRFAWVAAVIVGLALVVQAVRAATLPGQTALVLFALLALSGFTWWGVQRSRGPGRGSS